ncbi:GA-like domain-containing protein [Escherichia coli]
MKMIFTGKVSGEKTVLTAGARHTVKAQAGEQYGLVDEVTGLVPDGVEADRSGDDLILRKKEDDTEIRIEGFWEECQPGETQCTAVFNVVGENGQVTEAVLTQDGPVLENFTAGQSGTLAEGINNGIIWGGIAFGAGLAAIALAAGGGGGSSRHKRATEGEQKPVQPEGGQEAGKTDVSSTASTEAGSGSSSDQVPEVNDQNSNGKPDAQDAKDAEDAAKALVEAAEAKQAEAEGALTEANKDGAINPDEHTELTELNDAVTAAKADAQQAVDGLQDGPVKTGFSERLDKLDGITVPAVTDANDDGVADDKAAEVEAKVAAAESAEKAAEDELVKVNQDGVVGKAEAERLTELNDAVTAAKADAQQAVDGLQDGPVKTGFSERLDKLDGITVPAVTDANDDGVADDKAAEVEAKVAAAESAEKAAEDELVKVNQDGVVGKAEAERLTELNDAVTAAKADAQQAVDGLQDGPVKTGFSERLDKLDGITVPAVTDANDDGVADDKAAMEFYRQALTSNVSGDLYPQPSIFGDKVSSVSKNWSTLLDSNPGSYVTSQRLDSGANQYNYNGHTGSDVISITDSFGGLDRTQASRFPVGLFTGEGNDLIVTGRDYGRNTSAGYTDHSHRTDMGNGDDTLVVGVGNNDVTLYVNEEGQLRATTDSYNGSTSIDYTGLNSSSSGGTISGTDIVMGAGNDTVLALGYEGNSADAIINTNIDLGAGNDFIYANGEISTNNGTRVNIIGGEGFDTISLDNTTVTSAMFSGFEHVDLHSTSHLILNSDDFKSQDIEGGILKISGSSGASVDVQNFDWENLGSANDGDVKYFTYQSSDIPSLTLWIQEGIEVK